MTLRLLTRVSIFVVLALSWPASGRAGWVSAIAPHHAVFFGSGGGGTVKGRVAFFDSGNCFASSISQYRMSPEACNAFKRRFDPASGAPLTQETSGMRPLTATITVSYAMTPRAAKVGAPPLPGVLCPSRTVQTDRDGFFSVKLDGCFPSVVPLDGFGEPQTAPLPAPDLLKVRVELVYRIADRLRATAIAGEKAMLRLAPLDNSLPATIRALWRKDRILPYYPANFGPPVYTKVETGESEPAEYVLPVYEKTFPLPAGPRGQTVDAGVLAFPDEPRIQPSILEYLKKCLYNWQTLMELHFRAKERFAAEGRPELYDGLLIDKPETNCERCYTLSFTNSMPFSLGKNGIMLLNQPTPDMVWEPHGLEYVLGHEFGHGIHFGIAPPFPNWTDSDKVAVFGTAKRPNGEEYWTIHLPQQIHDNRIAFAEGLATALGEYLVHGCNAPWRTVSDDYPLPWHTGGDEWAMDASCDGENKCNYHRFRWNMSRRGIAEGSPVWNARLERLDALNAAAGQAHRKVTSHSESHWTTFFCDLLTTNTDISHMKDGVRIGQPGSKGYVDNYFYEVAAILEGRPFEASQVKFRHYESDVAPKGFQIGFSQLLEAVDDFCPACEGETLPAYGEPGYLDFWHSAHGPFSLQAIGLYLVDRGWMTESDLNNVLRANFSEEILRTGGFKAAMTRQPWKMQLHRTVSPAAMRFVEEIHGGTGVPTD